MARMIYCISCGTKIKSKETFCSDGCAAEWARGNCSDWFCPKCDEWVEGRFLECGCGMTSTRAYGILNPKKKKKEAL